MKCGSVGRDSEGDASRRSTLACPLRDQRRRCAVDGNGCQYAGQSREQQETEEAVSESSEMWDDTALRSESSQEDKERRED